MTISSELVIRFYDELWNKRRVSIAPEILDEQVSFRGSLGNEANGIAAVVGYVESVTTALSDYRCEILELVTEESKAAAKVSFNGIHNGTFLGFEPTGFERRWTGAAFFTVRNNRLSEIWVLGDLHSLYNQLENSKSV